jgi:hypothetical protein
MQVVKIGYITNQLCLVRFSRFCHTWVTPKKDLQDNAAAYVTTDIYIPAFALDKIQGQGK